MMHFSPAGCYAVYSMAIRKAVREFSVIMKKEKTIVTSQVPEKEGSRGWPCNVACKAKKVECKALKKSRLVCTRLLQWQEGYEDAWAILTDLAPQAAKVAWYRLRAWVECGFKDFKRGGFGWHHEKMQDAGRVERLWLAMAVAMVWMVSLGIQAESQLPAVCPEQLPERHIARKRMKRVSSQPPVRRLSCAQRGRLVLLAALLQAEELPIGRLLPEIWPETVVPPKKVVSPSKQRQRDKHRQRKRRQKKAARKRKAAT